MVNRFSPQAFLFCAMLGLQSLLLFLGEYIKASLIKTSQNYNPMFAGVVREMVGTILKCCYNLSPVT